MKVDFGSDLRELQSKYDLLEKLDYGVDFLKVYSEYLGIAQKLNNQHKIYVEKDLNLKDEPFMFIILTMDLLRIISDKKELLILEYKKESLEKDINEIRTNLAILSKRFGDIRFEKQFLHTQDLFNDFLDNIKTTKKGNDFFIKTDIANFFHTLVNMMKLKENKITLSMTPLEKMSSLDAYGIAEKAMAFIDTENVLPTSNNSSLKVKLSEMYDDWITKPQYTKKEMMAPVYLFQDKFFSLKSVNESSLQKGFWVTKDTDGNYSFDGNIVNIKNKNAQYVRIFDVAFSLKPQGGEILYDELIKQCHQQGLKKIKKNQILRALSGEKANFFRYVKAIKYHTPTGADLFTAVHKSNNLLFNNKKR